jgi:hypothetical protein
MHLLRKAGRVPAEKTPGVRLVIQPDWKPKMGGEGGTMSRKS